MALYHSYRPQSFDDVLGQPHVVGVLKSAITHDRVGHAYLFSGPRGVGKTSIARILAKAINCEQRTANSEQNQQQSIPCNTCSVCTSITNGSALDVVEIDAASNRGIDEIRELRDRVRFAPTAFRKKVYIIDEVHMLTKEAFNALLKTLEEPPDHAVFVLATTELAKIPETILSRCQHFQFRRANPEAVGKHLAAIAADEGRSIDADALELLVLRSEGSYRDALSALEQVMTANNGTAVTSAEVRELFGLPSESTALDTLAAIAVGDTERILETLSTLSAEGIALEGFLDELIRTVRQLLFITTLGQDRFSGGSDRFRAALPALLDAFDASVLIRLLTRLAEALVAMRTSPLPTLPVELLLLDEANQRSPQPNSRPKARPAAAVSMPSASEAFTVPVAEPSVDAVSSAAAEAAVPTTVSEQPSTEPKPAGAIDTLELTHELWRSVRQTLAAQDSSLTMLLGDQAEPPRIEENRVMLEVPYKFHADRLMAAAPRRAIEAALSEALNRAVVLECVLVPLAKRPIRSNAAPVGAVVEDITGALSEL